MTAPRYSRDAPCERTACTGDGAHPADHRGAAHLDPRDRDRYDGLTISYGAAPSRVQDAAKPLMIRAGAFDRAACQNSPLLAAVEVALDAAFREIDRLRTQVAHVQVDADHKVIEAGRRSGDCAHHGQEIRDLNWQLDHWVKDRDRVERARQALLGGLHALRELAEVATDLRGSDQALTADQLADAIGRIDTTTSKRHDAAWRKP